MQCNITEMTLGSRWLKNFDIYVQCQTKLVSLTSVLPFKCINYETTQS